METTQLKRIAYRRKECVKMPYDAMLDVDGYDALEIFTGYFGGMNVYVPSMRTIFADCIEQEILAEHSRLSMRELVGKYGYSERHIREMIRRRR